MESAVDNLEKSVQKADSRLDDISWKLDLFDREVVSTVMTRGNEVSVMTLMDRVSQVKEEYEHLRQEILEVQELQKTVRYSLHYKTLQVQQRMNALRSRINSKSLPR